MKKLLILSLTLIFLASCDVTDDDDYSYSFDVLPIESVDIPDEFTLGETYPITVEYFIPTSCHMFNDFYYYKENNERTVAVINVNYDRSDCVDLDEEVTSATFNFQVTGNGSYIFKFWQGKDDNDEDQYLTFEVPVVE